MPVSTSIMSRTRSSALSPPPATSTRRPYAAKAASRYSTPKRASRSRCPATITMADGSDKTRRSFGRFPFTPEPTSRTTPATTTPCAAAHPATRPAGRPAGPRPRADHPTTPARTAPPPPRTPAPARQPRSFPSRSAAPEPAVSRPATTATRSGNERPPAPPIPEASHPLLEQMWLPCRFRGSICRAGCRDVLRGSTLRSAGAGWPGRGVTSRSGTGAVGWLPACDCPLGASAVKALRPCRVACGQPGQRPLPAGVGRLSEASRKVSQG